MKNCKTFYEFETAILLKEIFQPSPQDKILPGLWNKKFLTETYRNIQKFAFEVLLE